MVFLGCSHPEFDKEPILVKMWDEVGLIRIVIFDGHEWKKVVLEAEELRGAEVLRLEVSRTWNPKVMGVSEDHRDLGVAVAILGHQ